IGGGAKGELRPGGGRTGGRGRGGDGRGRVGGRDRAGEAGQAFVVAAVVQRARVAGGAGVFVHLVELVGLGARDPAGRGPQVAVRVEVQTFYLADAKRAHVGYGA